MNKRLKRKWIEALRSGEYRQAQGCLKDGRRYCCLGVLIDIQGASWRGEVPKIGGVKAHHENGGWAALKFSGGLDIRTQERLSGMNDTGSSFSEIADYIEANL